MDFQTLLSLHPSGASLTPPESPVRVLGIDLGTTNSTVAEISWSPGRSELAVRCIEVEQDTTFGLYTHHLVPSAVALHDGKTIVGEGAKRLWARSAEVGLERDKNIFLECKNDIGVERTYHKAPPGFRNAAEIGGHVLRFLKNAAFGSEAPSPRRTVVTVPASFQTAQRIDTVKAAGLAEIGVAGGDLLDEPVAAFLDYVLTHSDLIGGDGSRPRKLLVFDFGGGTCDVAVFLVGRRQGVLQISPLAVSRYHRLGGGDLDRAILYEVIVPQLIEQNGLAPHALTFEDKKNVVEPAFLGLAEALKVGLCSEIARLEAFGRYVVADKSQVIKRQPGQHTCEIKGRTLTLQSPSLSAAQFEKLLAPFIDRSLLFARETEYRLTCSVFAPIQDALDRAELQPADVDMCLMVGGSSLIPQVNASVRSYFPSAQVLSFADKESVQLAVARGAAWHAFSLAVVGRGLFDVVAQDRISIATSHGALELVPKGASLPFPRDAEWAETTSLIVPDSSFPDAVRLLIEIRGGEEGAERKLYAETWEIPSPVAEGDKLRMQYRFDENQVLSFRLTLADSPGEPFNGSITNPLSNVVNPHATRIRIQRAEEDLRTGKVPAAKVPSRVVEIARDYAELKQTEKAISYLERALRMRNEPDPGILNLLGIYYGELGNAEMEEKVYRECAAISRWDAPLFNLALAQKRRRDFTAAARTVDECLERLRHGPTLTLKAQIADALQDAAERDRALREALSLFTGPRAMSDWELGWYLTAAQMAGEHERVADAQKEQQRRRTVSPSADEVGGVLPSLAMEGGGK